MKLYHISADIKRTDKSFTPRIPDLGEKETCAEDLTIPRICFSETVNGCISALPPQHRSRIASVKSKFVLYEINTEDYPSSFFISNEEIVKRRLVYDASLTKEWWAIEPVRLMGKICEITNIEARPVLNFSLIDPAEVVQTAERIAGFKLPEEILSDAANSEKCYDDIIHYTDKNKLYDVCDALFDELSELHPEAQTWDCKISYEYLPEKEQQKEME